MTALVTKNPLADGADWPPPPDSLAQFHHRMPAYAPTLLLDAPALAERFGVGRVVIKAETRRMGLPSFKILGASWATYQAIAEHIGHEPEPWVNINELAVNLAHLVEDPGRSSTAGEGDLVGFLDDGTVHNRIAERNADLTCVGAAIDDGR